MLEPVLARNVSVLASDQQRVEAGPLMSLDGAPSPRGDRVYVGKHQKVTVSFPKGWDVNTALEVPVALDHVPVDAIPASGIKASGAHVGATIEEDHATAWTETLVYFRTNVAPATQVWIVL